MNPFLFMVLFVWATSCTVSFQNISTNGKAEDVVDEDLETRPNINPNIDMKLIP